MCAVERLRASVWFNLCMSAITLRDADRSEIQKCLTIVRRSGLGNLSVELDDLPHTVAGVNQMAIDNGVALVAVADGRVVGVSWARNRFSGRGRLGESVWCWETLAVHTDRRNQGIGSALSRLTLERAASAGVELVYGVCAPSVVAYHERSGLRAAPLGHSLIVTTPSPMVAPLAADDTNCFVYAFVVDSPTVKVDVVKATRAELERAFGQAAEPRR